MLSATPPFAALCSDWHTFKALESGGKLQGDAEKQLYAVTSERDIAEAAAEAAAKSLDTSTGKLKSTKWIYRPSMQSWKLCRKSIMRLRVIKLGVILLNVVFRSSRKAVGDMARTAPPW